MHAGPPLPTRKPRYHKHSKAVEVRKLLGKAWDECFKFAFVRNPWDLMVSCYHWWLNYAEEFPALDADVARIRAMGSFPVFLKSKYGQEMINEHHGRDMVDWIAEEGEIIVDFVGRYESLDADWAKVCRALRVSPVPLGRENQFRRAHYREFYDEESKQLVSQRFSRSIDLFDYSF